MEEKREKAGMEFVSEKMIQKYQGEKKVVEKRRHWSGFTPMSKFTQYNFHYTCKLVLHDALWVTPSSFFFFWLVGKGLCITMGTKNENIFFSKREETFFAHEKVSAQDTQRNTKFFLFFDFFEKKKLKRSNKTANDTWELTEEEESQIICRFFCVKHCKGKKRKKRFKKQSYQNMYRGKFFEKNPPTRKLAKNEIFYIQENREERFPFFYRKLQSAKKHKEEKWTKKGGKDSFENKGENTRTENIRKNNEEGGKERVKRRFPQRKIFLFDKTFFRKKIKKRQVKKQKRISQNIEKRR